MDEQIATVTGLDAAFVAFVLSVAPKIMTLLPALIRGLWLLFKWFGASLDEGVSKNLCKASREYHTVRSYERFSHAVGSSGCSNSYEADLGARYHDSRVKKILLKPVKKELAARWSRAQRFPKSVVIILSLGFFGVFSAAILDELAGWAWAGGCAVLALLVMASMHFRGFDKYPTKELAEKHVEYLMGANSNEIFDILGRHGRCRYCK